MLTGYSPSLLSAVFLSLSLLEMMLESSLSDLRDSQGVSLPYFPSLLRLLRLLQDFLFSEGTDNQALWSEKVQYCTMVHTLSASQMAPYISM